MKIRNSTQLATTPARKVAIEVAGAGLSAIDTETVLRDILRIDGDKIVVTDNTGKSLDFALKKNGKLTAVLVGKCAAPGATAFEKILDGKLSSGIALGVGDYGEYKALTGANWPLSKIRYLAGTHPMPSERNLEGTRSILNSLSGLSADDTVIFLISGGGSTLLVQPPCVAEKMSELVSKEKDMLGTLFKVGASIQEINTVRKHMSLARGGFLAAAAHPAQVISIIFSDVPGNDIQFIASGPTVKDDSTLKDAEGVIKKYSLSMDNECLTETPKDDEYFRKVTNILALSNESALRAMKDVGEKLGYSVQIKNACLIGEARDAGTSIANEINSAAAGTILLYCGETTVTVKGDGSGGRNQELALGALEKLERGRVVLSLASDGHDNGEHAGALADESLMNAAKSKGMKPEEYLANNDSSAFFEAIGSEKGGGLIETGPTGSNVSDLIIAATEK